MRIINSISIIFIFGIFSFAQESAIVTLTSSQDVLINSQNVKEGLEYLAFGTTIEQHKYRSLLKFELKDLPLGQLKEATLSLTMQGEGNGVISLHKVHKNWKGSKYDITDYANWSSSGIAEINWEKEGGDFFSIPSGRAIFNKNETLDIFGPRMKLDIEGWIENPSSNFGWVIMGAENTINSKTQFYSGKNITLGPILRLIYELPDSCFTASGKACTINNQTRIAKCHKEDFKIDLVINGAQGENKIWLICNDDEDILGFSTNTTLDITSYPEKTLYVYHLSFNGEIIGASIGNNIRNLEGCHALSNKIEISDNSIFGGEITTSFEDTEVTICPLNDEDIDNLIVKNMIGISSSWVVLNNEGFIEIIGSQKPYGIKDLPAGSYKIRHLSFQGELIGLNIGNNISDVFGCLDWSNPIDVNLLDTDECRPSCSLKGGIIRGEELQICPSSTVGASFNIDSLVMSDNYGPFALWLLTDRRGNTLEAIPNVGLSRYQLEIDEIVYLFHVTYDELTFQFRNNIYDLDGCYGISNGLLVRGSYEKGCPLICNLPVIEISSDHPNDSIDLCVNSTFEDLSIISNTAHSYPSRFVIRDAIDSIISIGGNSMKLEFEKNGVYNLSQIMAYDDSAFQDINRKIRNENTCFSFSNNLILVQSNCPFICKVPENIDVNESDIGNVSVGWDRMDGAARYEFEVGFDTDTTDLAMLNTTRNWIRLSNPSNRSLIFRVRSNCGKKGFSNYSDFIQFSSDQSTLATSRSSEVKVLEQRFTISPNPAWDRIQFDYNTHNQFTTVEVYNAMGKLRSKKALNSAYSNHVVDISQLELGVHILQLRSANGIEGQKWFLKIR